MSAEVNVMTARLTSTNKNSSSRFRWSLDLGVLFHCGNWYWYRKWKLGSECSVGADAHWLFFFCISSTESRGLDMNISHDTKVEEIFCVRIWSISSWYVAVEQAEVFYFCDLINHWKPLRWRHHWISRWIEVSRKSYSVCPCHCSLVIYLSLFVSIQATLLKGVPLRPSHEPMDCGPVRHDGYSGFYLHLLPSALYLSKCKGWFDNVEVEFLWE